MSSKVAFIVGGSLGHVGRCKVILDHLCKISNSKVTVISPSPSPYLDEVIGTGMRKVLLSVSDRNDMPKHHQFAQSLEPLLRKGAFDLIAYDISPLIWLATTKFPPCPRVCITNAFLTAVANLPTAQVAQFARSAMDLNQSRVQKNLPPIQSAYQLYDADKTLLADPLPIVSRFGTLPSSYVACGHISWSAKGALPITLSSGSRVLAIAMGSTGRFNVPAKLVREVSRIAECSTTICAGSGAEQTGTSEVVDHCYELLPLHQVLDHCGAMICHGGAGSIYASVAKGVPIFVIPRLRNQQILGDIIEAMGIGVCLDQDDPTRKLVGLDFHALHRRAAALAIEIQQESGGLEAAKHIAEML